MRALACSQPVAGDPRGGEEPQSSYVSPKGRVVQKLMTLAPQHGGVSTCMQASWPHSTWCRGWEVLCCALTSLKGSGKRVPTMGVGLRMGWSGYHCGRRGPFSLG